MIVALSNESPSLVGPYVEKQDLGFLVAAGCDAAKEYGIPGYPTTFLVDPDGFIVWSGHPMTLTGSTIKKALKGARDPEPTDFLRVSSPEVPSHALRGAVQAAEEGELGKALEAAAQVADDERSSEEERAEAAALRTRIEGHVALVNGQIDGLLEARQMLRAVEALEVMADALEGTSLGKAAGERLDHVEKDPELSRELEAARELVKLEERLAKSGIARVQKKLEALRSDYPGTRAAERAKDLLRQKH